MLNKKMLLILILLVFSSKSLFSQPLSSSFTLKEKASTSAGIYKQDGTLVRTLWSGIIKDAGTYPIVWDGTDDHLKPLPADNYTFKVLSNNVQYKWEGIVGNTSTGVLRQDIHTSFEPFNKMVITGDKAFYSVGYNEGNADVAAFNLNNIQVRLDPYKGFGGWVMSDEIATDGVNNYITAWDNYHPEYSFIYARRISDNSIVNFAAGTTYQGTNIFFTNVIDLRKSSYLPTGITVSNSYIFVSYKAGNIISVLNKKTGELVRTIPISAPTSISIDGSNLWITTNNTTIQKYRLNDDGSIGELIANVTGLSDVVDMKVGGAVLGVVDGGTSQQVKAFSTSNGLSLWTLGQAGGIKASPLVTDDRFAFWHIQGDGLKHNRGGIAFAPDGSFWVIDPSNNRMQHYDANRNFIERIMYLQHTRSCVVVGNNNKRVLTNGFEFEIDYTKPLESGWKLKYNWEGNLNGNFVTEEWIKSVNTLSNGRTYGLIYKTNGYPSGGGGGGLQVVELNPATGIRYTNTWVNNNVGGAAKMYPDGAIYGIGGMGIGETEEWNKMTLVGFDNNNDPVYAATNKLPVSYPVKANEPRLSGPRPFPYEKTSSNILVLFKGDFDAGEDGAYHLGGMDAATGKVMFKTSMSTFREYKGTFPSNGDFDAGNGVGYAGTVGLTQDRSIIWGYNGEFWKAGQTNKYNHYYDNGLFIGQFGVVGDQFLQDPVNFPEMAGNAYMPQLTKEGSDYYLYHNDESVHGGLHRWKISNIASIQEQSVAILPSLTRSNEDILPAGVIDLMAGLPYKAKFTSDLAGWSITQAANEEWSAQTNVLTYGKRKNPDMYIVYNGRTTATNVSRSLGTNTNLTSWDLSGKIAYNGTNPNYWDGSATSAFFDVLDNKGKIIVRIQQISDVPHLNTIFKVNNTAIFSKETAAMQEFTSLFRDISISKRSNSIGVTFAGFSNSVTATFEPGADIANPATMRMYFNNGSGTGDAKQIGLDRFKFVFANKLAIPAAPTLAANDTTNTLSASHVLGTTEILVSENNAPYTAYAGQINVGNVARSAGYWKFKIKAASDRNESDVVNSPAFTQTTTTITTPAAPQINGDDVANTLSAYHSLGNSEILVSENGGLFNAYMGPINVGNVTRPAGYWKFKTKATTERNESAIVASPAFSLATTRNAATPVAPKLSANDAANTLIASHTLGDTEIVVSVNDAPFKAYAGQINLGNVARAAGYWKFKIKEAPGRNESEIVESPAFTITTTPGVPTLTANDAANTLSVSHTLGNSEIVVSVNNTLYKAYTGQINLGNVARPAGYWKFKVKAATARNESAVVNSPAFTITTTPGIPTMVANDVTNTIDVNHPLGVTEIVVSVNGAAYKAYGGQINTGNVARPAGYWKFKIKAAPSRNESAVINSPAFTVTTTPGVPVISANDAANILSVSHPLGNSEIVVSVNDAAYKPYIGQINVGDVARPIGYWKFKIKAATARNESAVVSSPAFTITGSSASAALKTTVATSSVVNSSIAIDNVVVADTTTETEKNDKKSASNNEKKDVGENEQSKQEKLVNPSEPTNVSNSLMIQVSDLKAVQIKQEILVTWFTKAEANTTFAIERALEGGKFVEIGHAFRKNNTATQLSFLDDAPVNGKNYYRVKYVNASGEARFSNTVVVANTNIEQITAYPNPVVGNRVSIKINDIPAGNYQIFVMDNMGKTIFKEAINHPEGTIVYSIPLSSNLTKGIYNLYFSGRNIHLNKQILK